MPPRIKLRPSARAPRGGAAGAGARPTPSTRPSRGGRTGGRKRAAAAGAAAAGGASMLGGRSSRAANGGRASNVSTGRVPRTGGGLITSNTSSATAGNTPNARRGARPTPASGASIQSLLRIMITQLASIDETLKNQLDLTRSLAIQSQQSQRELDYEKTKQGELIGGGYSGYNEGTGIDNLGGDLLKTGLLATFLALPNLLEEAGDEVRSGFDDFIDGLKETFQNPEELAAATAASVGTTAAYKSYAERRNARFNAAPHTKETVSGQRGRVSPLTAAEQKVLREQNIRYNQATGRYHEIRPDGKSGKMITNQKAAEALEKGRPKFKLPVGERALGRIAGGTFSVGMEAMDYIRGRKELNEQNLLESAAGVSSGLVGAEFGAAAGATLGAAIPLVGPVAAPVLGFAGGIAGYFGGDYIGRYAVNRLRDKKNQGESKPSTPLVKEPPKVGSGGETSKTNKVDPKEIAEYLKSKGVSDYHAAGMIVNIREESAFNSGATNFAGERSGGLFQHNGERFERMKKVAGENWQQNWKGQIDYALSEPDTKKYLSTSFMNATDAASWFLLNWERPSAKYATQRLTRIDRRSDEVMQRYFSEPTNTIATTAPTRSPTVSVPVPPPPLAAESLALFAPPIRQPEQLAGDGFNNPIPMARTQSLETAGRDFVPSPNMFDSNQDWALYFN